MMGNKNDRYVVFGNPIGHSLSPRIHALFAAQTGQSLSYESVLAPLDGFSGNVAAFAATAGRGANVTIPFKEEAYRLATRLTSRAAAAGAVNTLSFTEEGIVGDNTDGAGLVQDLKVNLGCDIRSRRILLLGAGGAARGVVLPLLQEGPAALIIANRTVARAQELCEEFVGAVPQPTASSFADLAGQRFDIIINATAAGLTDSVIDLPPNIFVPGGLAYDMVYGRETPFMTQAREAGARVADGLGMLVEQAAEAFYVWRGVRPYTKPVIQALRAE
jgi:shikimate dehydrogenase